MNNPTYDIMIVYVPPKTNGVQNVFSGGVTYSVSTQSPEYFVASMRAANISATGSDYRGALNNLLILATASTTPNPNVIPYKETW